MSREHADRVFSARQRLAFGTVAEVYDRVRPAYPAATIDGLVGHAGLSVGDVLLEVGAGTGIATRQLAQRGLGIVANEPSAEMATVGARRCDWAAEIDAADELFAEPRTEWVHGAVQRSADQYVELLGTHQDHILEQPARHDALLAAIAKAIDRSGAGITLPTTTRLCLARRR